MEQKGVAVIHGSNSNMLGKREIGIYGDMTMEQINAEIAAGVEQFNNAASSGLQ